ncbi:MAG: SDR family oxidoreductase [Actinomycetota bacterium]
MFDYSDKKVVLTGGASGVGAAAVRMIADLGGTDLTVLDVQEPTGPASRFIPTDMSDPASIDAAIAEIGGGVDVLFNNAGIAGVHEPDLVLRVNALGPARLTRGLLGGMSSGAAIVNTASIAGQRWADNLAAILEFIAVEDWEDGRRWVADHTDLTATDPYGFSKQFMQVWTMQAARSMFNDRGIRINSVCPGPIDTPLIGDFIQHMTEQVINWAVDQAGGVMLTADEVASTVVMLGSDASAGINGHNVIVDKGLTASVTTGQADDTALGLS